VRFAAVLLGLVLLLAVPLPAYADPSPASSNAVVEQVLDVNGPPEPGSAKPVHLDARVFRPGDDKPAPAILLAHGFGGSWHDMEPMARQLAEAGFLVVVWTSRGLGDSGGMMHLADRRYEARDVSAIIDLLPGLPVIMNNGDPVVAVAGVSYGGAIALQAAAIDPRIDAVVPIATWADLAAAFFPNALGTDDVPTSPVGMPVGGLADTSQLGPLQVLWLTRFFATVNPSGGFTCGRIADTWCSSFIVAALNGAPSAAMLTAMQFSSPVEVLDRITVPVLVVPGDNDTLFGLDQSALMIHGLTASPSVSVRWFSGGHDTAGFTNLTDTDINALIGWLRQTLAGAAPAASFTYPVPRKDGQTAWFSVAGYPGIGTTASVQWTTLEPDDAQPVTITSPDSGEPASLTDVVDPAAAPSLTWQAAAPAGQSATFDFTVPRDVVAVGAPRLSLQLARRGGSGPTSLYVTLWRLDADGNPTLPHRLVAPVHVAADASQVVVRLPASVYRMDAGSTWRVLVTATNSSFSNPMDSRTYELTPLGLAVPTVPGAVAQDRTGQTPPVARSEVQAWAALAALGVVAVLAVAAAAVRDVRARRRGRGHATERASSTPTPPARP